MNILDKKHRDQANWIGIPAIVGALVGVLTGIFSGDNTVAVTSSILAVIASALLELTLQLRNNQEELLGAWQTHSRVAELRDVGRVIQGLVEGAETITENPDPKFHQALADTLQRTLDEVQEMATGHLQVRDRDTYLKLITEYTAGAQSSVVASSLFSTGNVWGTEEGDKYLEANGNAIANGVNVTRVFIFEADGTPEDAAEIRKHHDLGVSVRTAQLEKLQDQQVIDATVIDEQVLFITAFVPGTNNVQGGDIRYGSATRFLELKDQLERLAGPGSSSEYHITDENEAESEVMAQTHGPDEADTTSD